MIEIKVFKINIELDMAKTSFYLLLLISVDINFYIENWIFPVSVLS